MPTSSIKPSDKKSATFRTVARVVLVDDHPMVREHLRELIKRDRNLDVCGEAEDVESGLAVIEQTRPHLVVVDLSLKGGYGLDLIRRAKADHPEMKFMVLTMHEASLHAENALRAGAAGYLTKREATKRILEAIHTVLSGQPYVSGSVAVQVAANSAAGGATRSAIASLSDRELQVLRELGDAVSSRVVAENLGIDVRTVETYRTRIRDKLGLATGHELLRFAIEWKNSGAHAS